MSLEEVHERIALRRVHEGHVRRVGGWRYLTRGAPVPSYLPPALDTLIERGLAELADPDPNMGNAQRLSLTPLGIERFNALCGHAGTGTITSHTHGVLTKEGISVPRRHTKSKASRGLVTRTIVYRDDRNPPGGRPLTLKVDLRRDEYLDTDHATAMVAARQGVPLVNVRVIEITDD